MAKEETSAYRGDTHVRASNVTSGCGERLSSARLVRNSLSSTDSMEEDMVDRLEQR